MDNERTNLTPLGPGFDSWFAASLRRSYWMTGDAEVTELLPVSGFVLADHPSRFIVSLQVEHKQFIGNGYLIGSPHFLRVPQERPMYHSTSSPRTTRSPCEELSEPRTFRD